MEFAGELMDVLGMSAVLGSAAIVFITLLRWVAGRYQNRIALGLQMLAFFLLAYIFGEVILRWLSYDKWIVDMSNALATMWWLSLAFTINAALKVLIWDGILAERGESTVPKLLSDSVGVFIYLVAIMVVMHFVYGEPITAIAATSGAAAFIIGYSAQTTLGELFAGISLNLSRNFKRGDILQFDDVVGRVDDVNWRSVTLYEFATDSTVIYPNSAVAGSQFSNLSRPARRQRGSVEVTVEFSSPPELVVRAIRESLSETRYILRDPPPNVYVKGTGEMGIEYGILYHFSKFENRFLAKDEAVQGMWAAFKKHDIQPGTSHREFGPGSRFDEGGWPARHMELETETSVARTLARSPILRNLSTVDRKRLANAVIRHELSPPETLKWKGRENGSLYFVAEGRIGLVLEHEGYPDFVAMELTTGGCFGLTNILQSESLNASVQAIEFSVAYEVPHAALQPILETNPKVRERIQDLAKDRAAEYERRRKAHAVEVENKSQLLKKQDIMAGLSGRIGDLFKQGVLATMFGNSKAASNDSLMEAAMAATALVAIADGIVEDEERAHVISTFDHLDLLRHVDSDKGLARFDEYANAVKENWEEGIEKALVSVRKLKTDRASSELVLGICIAVSAADGEVEEPEEEMISRIREALELDEDEI